MTAPLRVGVVGLGYWGPNLARNLARVGELRWLCDLSEDNLARFAPAYPQATATQRYDDLLEDPELDAIAIATAVPTHHPLGMRALEAGKHLFVEKPLATSVAHASELVEAAEARGLTLMTGHLLLFHPAVAKVRELMRSGELGDLYYLYCNRQNLGKVREDENALWSLGAHDIAVLLDLVGEAPVECQARGESFVRPGVEDVVFGYVRFAGGVVAHLHLSWLDPHKMRKLTVVGSQKMVVFDDMESERKVTVYDKGVTTIPRSDTYGEYVQVRAGDIWAPRIAAQEPLRLECEEFAAAVRERRPPRADGREGLEVVTVLAALQRSLDEGGAVVTIGA